MRQRPGIGSRMHSISKRAGTNLSADTGATTPPTAYPQEYGIPCGQLY